MSNIQVTCAGNMFTKPMYCWSFLDSILLIVGGVALYAIWLWLNSPKKKR